MIAGVLTITATAFAELALTCKKSGTTSKANGSLRDRRGRHTVLLEVLPADPCLFIARVSHFSALNDWLEAAIDHAFAVEWHGIRLRLHAGVGHHLVPGRFARLLRWPDDPREHY